ncbi:hypothetical protein K0M31_012724 [Melipona bicolor]|uniref:RNA pseudouridylate synthase domain-containing protein 2 n=1 Tax=Melipona bicolor TaxID=60889 RepID=A0AA40FJ27_9HYME|nr:hypothetical protein K0M31_012724 [Melipona bicolor]
MVARWDEVGLFLYKFGIYMARSLIQSCKEYARGRRDVIYRCCGKVNDRGKEVCRNGLRKVYPYYFTFTTFTKGRWVGEKILEVFAREFRAHPAEEYERCIRAGTLTVNYQKVDVDYRLRHNDLLANVVHR